ncbi:hypothetical protein P43SY_008474 [Pythium insidiosum]|uniref:Uncharacterized protein n=1 Tax=Pythium insidiosum TaxID=114742 RepID=A0AAD5MJ05_PYTIN|nr:hypothetical protein P43SY_008474 [Pythium insidiosum]
MDPKQPPMTDKQQPPYASQDVPMGIPVAAPAPGAYPPPGYAAPGAYPPPGYAAAPAPGAYPPPGYVGAPAPVDAYGRPIVSAMPMQVQTTVVANNANIRRDAQGNALCNKCSAPYPLPAGCTSWRCRNCHELNNASVYGDECCTIL